MAGMNVPVVMVPRYTTYLSTNNFAFASQPVPVAAYSKITLDFWHAPIQGTGGLGVSVLFTESNDLATWEQCTGGSWFIPAGTSETQVWADLTRAWMQFAVVLSGINPGVTCWAQGFFEMRER